MGRLQTEASSSRPPSPSLSRHHWLAIAGVAVVAVAVRSVGLGSVPLWTDELFTRFYAHAGLHYMWGTGFREEPTPPLYYSLIWFVEQLFGSSSVALRLPSVAGSLASVGLAWLLGRELFGRGGAALLAALLLSVAPVNVYYALEARTYALQGAALALALLGLARFLRGASGVWLYGAGAALSVWLHPTSVIAVAALNAGVAAWWLLGAAGRVSPLGRGAVWRWVAMTVAVAVVCLPLVPGILNPPGGGAATSWIPALSRGSLQSVIGETLAGPALVGWAQYIAEASVIALVALALIPPWLPGWRAAVVLIVVPGVALAVMIGVSAVKPILLTRTLAWLLVPLAVALGGILSRRPMVLRIGVVAVVAAGLAVQMQRGAAAKEDWPSLFAQMQDVAAPTLVVLAPHTPPGAVAVYGPGVAVPVRLDDGLPPMPETTIMPGLFQTRAITDDDFRAAVDSGRPVWLVYRRPEYDWVQRTIAGLPAPARAVQSEPGRNPALRALFWSR